MSLYFSQYYLDCLSHASYLVGDTQSGRAVVVDPQRDVEQYLNDAKENGLRIEKVIETHFHADFLSGHLELAAATGAAIVYGAQADGRVDFPIEVVKDGDRLSLGDVELEFWETPGHTPESISILVWENGKSAESAPYGVLTGDTLFLGDVGRPDLLSAVGFSADDLAKQLYHSVHTKLLSLPDETRVFPAHGAGSACGKNLSTDTMSTMGEQRQTNYALQPMVVEDFVDAVTQGQSVAPLYFLFAATKNRQQRELFQQDAEIRRLTFAEVLAQQEKGAVVIDSRDHSMFALGHLRGSINVGLSGRFAEYTGEVMEPGTPIIVVADAGTEAEAVMRLARIGFDNVLGVLDDPIAAFVQNPDHVEQLSRLSVAQLMDRIATVPKLSLVDIRNPGEVAMGMLPGAINISLPALLRSLDQLDRQNPVVVYCAGGYRSAIASSLLRSKGFTDVSDLIGGYGAWADSTLPLIVPAIEPADVEETDFLLDVREQDEWDAGHSPTATHIPMSELPDRYEELPTDKRIVVICRSGNRSAKVTAWLEAKHFNAINLTGGMKKWNSLSLPMRALSGSPQVI
ncbi:MAG: hypothetical protein RLZZ31_1819 [Actinomycetota bacterium]|jgi:rhodanese-related sulfurtransferase/glyoxylase-like metal-dependent hydrolase (beta-lactamase superfamily II)